ncbi:MAG: Phosphoribosylformylglycinamidine synthase [Candidatus Aminicenantes bacterium ADurb.Bin508]|nr:MAG: Phosphoribosylformylglycinamidine synthase [Candidatus Aminicenantes bacterium ADurb.Bin508]
MIPGGFSAGDEPDGSGKFISAVFRNPRLMDGVHRFLGRDGLILGICNGFQALLKLGLLTHGEIRPLQEDSPTLTFNRIGRHVASVITTRVASNLSPWMSLEEPGTLHQIPVSHGEGRFVAPPETLEALFLSGQVAAQYVDDEGRPRRNRPWNPNGSWGAVEALSSPDGRVLGKMAHTERVTDGTYRNIPGIVPQRLFEGGVSYFL